MPSFTEPISAAEEVAMPEPERIDRRRAALIAYDVCRRALTPSDPARQGCDAPGARCLGADDRGRAGGGRAGDLHDAGQPRRWRRRRHAADRPFGGDRRAATHQRVEGTAEAGFPDEIAPRPEDYVFLKRRPSAFYGTGVAELLHMLRRDIIIIGGGATNRGVETSVREAFNLDLASSWCASAAGAATRRPTPTASTRR
jgi:hypothetical protein